MGDRDNVGRIYKNLGRESDPFWLFIEDFTAAQEQRAA